MPILLHCINAGALTSPIGPQIEAAYRTQGKQDRSNLLDAAKLTTYSPTDPVGTGPNSTPGL